ncbi:MAG: hypothetical protein SFY66_12685 [Oculatellaceae cyanobacterium bins.114]|nr:hypothetical protein [Oculatellaceae cyanobacterium bins.114]
MLAERLYLHLPDHRPSIVEALEERDLDFSISHHRFLWQQILELEEGNSSQPIPDSRPDTNLLIQQLQDR